MTPEQIELAQRLVKHRAFKWSAGMLTHEGYRLIRPGRSPDLWVCAAHNKRALGRVLSVMTLRLTGSYPDLADPATRGCLLDLARTAWNRPALHAHLSPPYRVGFTEGPGWCIDVREDGGTPRSFHAATEGEVLALTILGAA